MYIIICDFGTKTKTPLLRLFCFVLYTLLSSLFSFAFINYGIYNLIKTRLTVIIEKTPKEIADLLLYRILKATEKTNARIVF